MVYYAHANDYECLPVNQRANCCLEDATNDVPGTIFLTISDLAGAGYTPCAEESVLRGKVNGKIMRLDLVCDILVPPFSQATSS